MAVKFQGGKAVPATNPRLAGLPQLTPAINAALNEAEQAARDFKDSVRNPKNDYAAGRMGPVADDYVAKMQVVEGGGSIIFAVTSSRNAGAVLTSTTTKMQQFKRDYPRLDAYLKKLGMREVAVKGNRLLGAVDRLLRLTA